MDAIHFWPQSRPRLFIVAVRDEIPFSSRLVSPDPTSCWHPNTLRRAFDGIPEYLKASWVWWRLPIPERRTVELTGIVDPLASGLAWDTKEQTDRLLGQMSDLNLEKVAQAKAMKRRVIGMLYRRTRKDETGQSVQRAEVRF